MSFTQGSFLCRPKTSSAGCKNNLDRFIGVSYCEGAKDSYPALGELTQFTDITFQNLAKSSIHGVKEQSKEEAYKDSEDMKIEHDY